jgi:hypothetical protein
LYKEIANEKKRLSDLENSLSDNPNYLEYQGVKMRLARLWKNVREGTNYPELFDDLQ